MIFENAPWDLGTDDLFRQSATGRGSMLSTTGRDVPAGAASLPTMPAMRQVIGTTVDGRCIGCRIESATLMCPQCRELRDLREARRDRERGRLEPIWGPGLALRLTVLVVCCLTVVLLLIGLSR